MRDLCKDCLEIDCICLDIQREISERRSVVHRTPHLTSVGVHKIAAIKLIRSITDLGLLESKMIIDSLTGMSPPAFKGTAGWRPTVGVHVTWPIIPTRHDAPNLDDIIESFKAIGCKITFVEWCSL